MENNKCSCCSGDTVVDTENYEGKYVCYCNKVTEKDIVKAIQLNGANSVNEVIKITGAMVNSNCIVNNPKGICCFGDIEKIFNKNKK